MVARYSTTKILVKRKEEKLRERKTGRLIPNLVFAVLKKTAQTTTN